MKYSLWIIPDKALQAKLHKIINKLAKKYNSPIFEAHMTLIGSVEMDLAEFKLKTKKLASKLNPFRLQLSEVSFSTTYFQNVFVRIKSNAKLMQANMLAKKIFKQENNVFMPHISLLYGNHKMELREKIAKSIKLPKVSFTAKSTIITPSTLYPSNWKHLETYNF